MYYLIFLLLLIVFLILILICICIWLIYWHSLRVCQRNFGNIERKVKDYLNMNTYQLFSDINLYEAAGNSYSARYTYKDKSLVVKCTQTQNLTFKDWLSYNIRGIIPIEPICYQDIFHDNKSLPKIYYTECDAKYCWFLIIMEFLKPIKAFSSHDLEPAITPCSTNIEDEIPTLLTCLANFHREYLTYTVQVPPRIKRKTPLLDFINKQTWYFNSTTLSWIYSLHHYKWYKTDKTKSSLSTSFSYEFRMCTIKILKLVLFNNKVRLPVTLIHGDPHSENFVFTEFGPKLIDWSAARTESPIFDVMYCIQICSHKETRRAKRNEWLQFYLTELNDNKLTYEEIERQYWYYLAQYLILITIPFCYAEGIVSSNNYKKVLLHMNKKRRIMIQTVMEACEEIMLEIDTNKQDSIAVQYIPAVEWIVNYGVQYWSSKHPPKIFQELIVNEFTNWQEKMKQNYRL